MKIRITIIAIATIWVLPTLKAQTDFIDGVVWTIGDEAILRSEVEEEIKRIKYDGTSIDGDPYCLIPEQMAIQKLFLHQALLDSVQLNDAAITSEVERRIEYFLDNIGSKKRVEETFGKDMRTIRANLTTMVRNQNLISQVQMNLVEDIEVTPAEVRRYFKHLSKDSIPTVPAQVEVQILSRNPPVTQAEKDRIKDKLREFTERISKSPSDFSMLARLYSDDKGSAEQGGDIGFVSKSGSGLDPAFAEVAFSLQDPKKVSKIVESEFGYHIIQLMEKRGEKIRCRHLLLMPKISTEDLTEGVNSLDSIAKAVRAEKLSFEQAVMLYSQDKNTAMNAGLMMDNRTQSSKFEYQYLPNEIAKEVYDMKVGEISDPFVMVSPYTRKEIIAVVRLKSKTPTHKANIVDDYQILKTMLENKKKEKFIGEWIKEKQQETYVHIDPAWRNCNFKYKGWIISNEK